MQRYSNESKTKMQKRERIVETARKMFHEEGMAKTTMKDISNVTGIGRSTMYEYFNSKEELMRLIKRIYLREIYDFNFDIDESKTGFEQLESILVEYFERLLRHPQAVVFFVEYNRAITVNRIEDDKIKFQIYKTHKYLSRAIEKGIEDKSLDIPNLEKRVEIAVEAMFGVALSFASRGEYQFEGSKKTTNTSEVRDLIPILMNGLKTDKCSIL